MIRLMGIVGKSLIAVVLAVTALGGAFDGCLMNCHAQALAAAGTQAHAHCHPAPSQQAGVRWQADPTCRHDHAVSAAESVVRPRLDSRPLGVVALLQTLAVRPLAPLSSVAGQSTADPSRPTVALVPLRV